MRLAIAKNYFYYRFEVFELSQDFVRFSFPFTTLTGGGEKNVSLKKTKNAGNVWVDFFVFCSLVDGIKLIEFRCSLQLATNMVNSLHVQHINLRCAALCNLFVIEFLVICCALADVSMGIFCFVCFVAVWAEKQDFFSYDRQRLHWALRARRKNSCCVSFTVFACVLHFFL